MKRLAVGLVTVGLGLAACSGADRPSSGPACKWAKAAWLRNAASLAGFSVVGCTQSGWIVQRGTRFLLWTSARPPKGRAARLAGVPVYGRGTRVAWRAQGLTVWIEPRPPRGRLAELVVVTMHLPRRYRSIALMPMPWGPLRKCRSSPLLRAACPRWIPRVPGWLTYPRYGNPVDTTFGLERGGEFPGKPELNRPPAMLHLEISTGVAFAWPAGRPIRPRAGLVRAERDRPIALGRVTWGGLRGDLALAPPFPTGGSQGNHLVFRRREDGAAYFIGLHAWEPFPETVAILERVVAPTSPSRGSRSRRAGTSP